MNKAKKIGVLILSILGFVTTLLLGLVLAVLDGFMGGPRNSLAWPKAIVICGLGIVGLTGGTSIFKYPAQAAPAYFG